MDNRNILTPFLSDNGTLVLDGGLATELERRGHDLNDPLWSAKLLLEAPESIRDVHLDYLNAGADCIITATYQATVPGFEARGLSTVEASQLIQKAVELALEAKASFMAGKTAGQRAPLIAASVGPYGAYLANGAEYTGQYDLDADGLYRFHRDRWHQLAHSGADLLACETIPSFAELKTYLKLSTETPERPLWLAFSCRNGKEISDGTPIATCASLASDYTNVVALGINCTPPSLMPSLIQEIEAVTDRPIIVYPNSGEHYDPQSKSWSGTRHPESFGTAAREWRKMGATLLGGCCRTTPAHIQAIATRMKKASGHNE